MTKQQNDQENALAVTRDVLALAASLQADHNVV